MTYELGRALLLADAVSSEALADALLMAATERVSLVRALLETRAIDPQRLEEELARSDMPLQRHVSPVRTLVADLPPGLCARLVALPVRRDPRTGTVDVVVADARDPHPAEEIAFFLNAPVRMLRAPLSAIEAALGHPASQAPKARPMVTPPPAPVRAVTITPIWGTPIVNLGAAEPTTPKPTTTAPEAATTSPEAPVEIPIPLRRVLQPNDIEAEPESGMAGLISEVMNGGGAHATYAPLREAHEESFEDVAGTTDEHATLEEYPEEGSVDDEQAPAPESEPVVALTRTKPVSRPASRMWATTVASAPFNAFIRDMASAADRDKVFELVLYCAATLTRKAAVFVVKRDAFFGWTCTDDFADKTAFREVRIDSNAPTVLAGAVAAGSYAGAVLRNDANAPLLKLLKSPRPEVACASIKVGGRAAAVLLAHEIADPSRVLPAIDEVARAAGEALERVLRAKR